MTGCDSYLSLCISRVADTINENTSDLSQSSTSPRSETYYIGVYGGIVVSTLVAALVQSCLFAVTLTLSSERVHDIMFAALLRLPIKFFDTNPSGKVSFISDIHDKIDSNLIMTHSYKGKMHV